MECSDPQYLPGYSLDYADDNVVRDNVFQPFYTTRFTEPRAGLGLAIARSLARRSGGSLALETSFRSGRSRSKFLRLWCRTPRRRMAGTGCAGLDIAARS